MTIVASFLKLTPSPLEDILRSDLSTTDVFLFCWPLRLVRARPSMSSIICSRNAWSLVSMGTTEISRTARNWPQLLRCSFSRRKKFQIKRLKSHKKGNACDSSDWWLFSWSVLPKNTTHYRKQDRTQTRTDRSGVQCASHQAALRPTT